MDLKYLPPNRDKSFRIMKPNEMKLEHLEMWIEHIYARQVLKKDGRLDGPIFEFKTRPAAGKEASSRRKRAKRGKTVEEPTNTAHQS